MAVALSSALLALGAPAGAASDSLAASVIPADGRLNTPDVMAKVTAVAWPARNGGQEPTPGRRFVRFTLEVTALGASASPTSPAPSLSAALRWGATSHPLSLSSIDEGLQAGAGGSSDHASASYVASVPDHTHDVDVVLAEGSFSQSFNLWTLRRVPPSPTVLYRDPNETTLAGTAAGPATLALSNPADGFTSSATLTLQSATLGYAAPSGTTLAPNPDQAVLSVVLDAEFPNNPKDPAGSGHYLGATAPLPSSMLSFTPNGAGSVPATLSNAGDTSGKGNSDDGLFDATYSFLVPATLTSGTLTIAAGSFTGAEFTLYTAESGTTTLDVTAPATLALTFAAPVAESSQPTPPWVGQPDPPTSAAASRAATSSASSGSNGSNGFPIWPAVALLALVALAVVLVERRRRSARLASAPAQTPATAVSDVAPSPRAPASTVVPEPERTAVSAADAPLEPATAPEDNDIPDDNDIEGPALNVLGPHELLGLTTSIGPRLVELFVYLAFHAQRHLRAGQIQIGMSPSGTKRADLAEKTMRNYIHQLRGAVGVAHLPEASAKEGYILVGVPTDWEHFEALARQADVLGGEEADRARTEALSLVRGVPFCDLDYEWIGPEGLANQMMRDIAALALRLAQDRFVSADYRGAEAAAARGLVGAPDDYSLWEAGALAICARADSTALGRWMDDASHHLEAAELARIEGALEALHDDSSHS